MLERAKPKALPQHADDTCAIESHTILSIVLGERLEFRVDFAVDFAEIRRPSGVFSSHALNEE